MKLLVVRHAIAQDQQDFAKSGESDDQRPLTADGIAKMEKGAKGLKNLIEKIDILATSPLTRAAQTAAIISSEFEMGEAEVISALQPGATVEEFEEWASSHAGRDVVAIVGHEPHLSSLVTWLVVGRGNSALELKKGGACLVEFDLAPRAARGILKWLLSPSQLRRLA